jgi:hypothetical protein
MTISANSSDASDDPRRLTPRADTGSRPQRRLRRGLNARIVVALIALVSLVAPGVAAVIAAVL